MLLWQTLLQLLKYPVYSAHRYISFDIDIYPIRIVKRILNKILNVKLPTRSGCVYIWKVETVGDNKYILVLQIKDIFKMVWKHLHQSNLKSLWWDWGGLLRGWELSPLLLVVLWEAADASLMRLPTGLRLRNEAPLEMSSITWPPVKLGTVSRNGSVWSVTIGSPLEEVSVTASFSFSILREHYDVI